MNIIGVWNKEKIPGEHETSWPFGTLDLDISNNVTTIENESVKLVYEGTIFDRTPDELMNSQTALDNAYGLYSYVKINENEQEIIIGTDKLGFSPIYYSMQEDALIFSTSLTLLKFRIKKTSPDYEAWDEMLNLDTILGEKTTIKEIKRLNPGTIIHIDKGKVEFREFWSPEVPSQIDKGNFIRCNNELLAEALELTRHITNPRIVLLSGGEDGRRIGVSAHAIGLPISFAMQETGFLQGFDENKIIVDKVSKYLNYPLICIGLPSAELSMNDMHIRNYWLGFETHFHDWIIPLIKNLPASSLIYDGIAGDVIINGHWARLFPERYKNKNIDQVARLFCGKESTFQIDKNNLNSSLFERVRNQLLRYPDCPARVDYFYLMNRARRTISLMAQLYNLMGHKTCYPFLYYPLFMHSLSLNPKKKIKVLYQRACIEGLNSGISEIPTTRDVLSDEYLIDRSKEGKERELLLTRKVALRSEVKKIFPHLRTHFLAHDLASLFGITKITYRMNWRTIPLSRMSMFFDWLEDSNQPGFPVSAEEPSFLKERFIV